MPAYNSYANLIFDFGGVILNIEPEKTLNGFINLGLKNTNSFMQGFQNQGIFDRFEKGDLSPAEFRRDIRKYLTREVTDQEIDTAWNAMLLDLPGERLELLTRLKQSHRLFLLSNSNRIHWEAYTASIQKEHGVGLAGFFEKTFFSHDMGCRKPDLRIYQQLLDSEDLTPEETLFIDDTLENIAAARQLGMGAYHLQSGENILEIFKTW